MIDNELTTRNCHNCLNHDHNHKGWLEIQIGDKWTEEKWFPETAQARPCYLEFARHLGEIWSALGWKVSTWVHWVVCHSHALATRHLNFYMFSSIPTERRNVEFKLDVTHCFKGWKLSRPHACTRGFALVLELAALDIGLLLEAARTGGGKTRKRRANA